MLKKIDFVWWLIKMFARTLMVGLRNKKFKVNIKAEGRND